ncbi:hypothetical protein [Methylobacter tundripaludum]|uniref:hypothetical protein n=1 Tax=Methylobacter tundripaludum TaxID=173365 RepID=UPI0004DEF7DC|nr:hypothetical protein [Methylobacter tundripaludum]
MDRRQGNLPHNYDGVVRRLKRLFLVIGELLTRIHTTALVIPAGNAGIHDCTDAGGRAPTVGALGDAGAVAEKPWMA